MAHVHNSKSLDHLVWNDPIATFKYRNKLSLCSIPRKALYTQTPRKQKYKHKNTNNICNGCPSLTKRDTVNLHVDL